MIDYMALIKRAWQITLRNKFLWIFGLFLGGISIGGGANIGLPSGNQNSLSNININQVEQSITNFFEQHSTILLTVVLILLLIIIIWLIMSHIAQGAIIGSVADIHQDKKHRFKSAFKIGTRYFWRILGLNLLVGLAGIIIAFIFFVPSFLFFIYKSYILGMIIILPAILFIIISILVIGLIAMLAQRSIVVKDEKILKGISLSYKLIKKNLKEIVFFVLISWAINIIIAMGLFVGFAIVVLFLGLIGLVVYTITIQTGFFIFISLSVLLIIALSLFIQAILGTFYSAFMTLFWLKIVEN